MEILTEFESNHKVRIIENDMNLDFKFEIIIYFRIDGYGMPRSTRSRLISSETTQD